MFHQRLIVFGVFSTAVFAGGFDDKVRADFFAGFAGDKTALERAMQASEKAIAENPGEAAEALAWHGSGLMAQSGEKFRGADYAAGSDLWARGLAEMDKAGQMQPDSPQVLIPRAAAWFGVSRQAPPDMGGPLIAKAIADYEHVYDLQKEYFDKLNIHMRSELLFGLADGYYREGHSEKARFYFEKLAAVGPTGGHYAQAEAFLKGDKYTVQGIGCVGCHTGK